MNEVIRAGGVVPYPDAELGYENALDELGRLFGDRGLARAVRNEADAFERKVREQTDPSSIRSRMSELLASDDGAEYRTDGGAEMTNDDAVRLFYAVSGRRRVDCAAQAESMRSAFCRYTETHPVRPATIYSIVESTEESLPAEAGETALVETHRDEHRRYLAEAITGLFPQDRIGRARRVRSLTSATAAIALLVILALTLMLPVVLTVMINRVSRDISDYEDTLHGLEATEERLQVELADKNDLQLIEKLATTKYGMVKLEIGTTNYLKLNSEDKIETFDPAADTGNPAVLALLSALGIRIGE